MAELKLTKLTALHSMQRLAGCIVKLIFLGSGKIVPFSRQTKATCSQLGQEINSGFPWPQQGQTLPLRNQLGAAIIMQASNVWLRGGL